MSTLLILHSHIRAGVSLSCCPCSCFIIISIVLIKYIIWCNLNFRNLIENCVANSCDIQEWWKPSESVKLDIQSGTCSRTLWIATESSPRASDHPIKRTAGLPPTKSAPSSSVGGTTRSANPKSSSRYLTLLMLCSECFIHIHLLSGYKIKKIKVFFKVFFCWLWML